LEVSALKSVKSLKSPLAILGISAVIIANLLFVRGEANPPPAEVFTQPDKVHWRTLSAPPGSEWFEYEVYLPQGQYYRMWLQIMVDGVPRPSGGMSVYQDGREPQRFRLRMNTEDDRRFKDLLKSQKIAFDEKTQLLTMDWEMESPSSMGGTGKNPVRIGRSVSRAHEKVTLSLPSRPINYGTGRTISMQTGALDETVWLADYKVHGDSEVEMREIPRDKDWADEYAVRSGGHRVRFGIRFTAAPDLLPGRN
jgi:hypothetical protein